ncbi:MAG: VWA domain-containing protein [Acidobacteriota bacterium]
MTMLPRTTAGILWVLMLLSALGAGAQAPDEVFSEVFDVRVVNLEVVVTDRKGNRITGLQPEDFELFVDGEPTTIDYFTEVIEGAVQEGEGLASAYTLNEEGRLPINYLVFFDDYFSIAVDRNRVIDGLLDELDSMGSGDRMAIVRFDGKKLDMVQSWTRSKLEMEESLQKARRERTFGIQRLADIRRVAGFGDSSFRPFGGASNELTLEERYVVERLTSQVDRAVSAATSALRSLGRPGGRNVMLMMAGGWPFDPVEFVLDDLTRPVTERLPTDARFAPLIDTANLLGYTLYPVDVPGLTATAVTRTADEIASTDLLRPTSVVREQGLHQTLELLAKDTGGRAMINSNRAKVLGMAAEDTLSFYSLGFNAPRAGDDQEHRTEVKVKGDRLRVRARKGYIDFSRSREVTFAVESALLFGAPPSTEPLQVRLGKPKRSGLRRMTAELEIGIPSSAMTFLPGPEGETAQVELRIAVLDEDGAKADTPVIPLVFGRRTGAAETGQIVPYATKIQLRRKRQSLVIAVYDLASGAIVSSVVDVNP